MEDDFVEDLPYDIKPQKSVRISQEAWEQHRDTILRLYIDERKTLLELMSQMQADSGFYAT